MNRRLSPFFINYYWDRIRKFLFTFLALVSARYWGVNLGKHCVCNGAIKFRKWQNSKITVGDNCRFNNSYISNWIGVYIPCIFTTIAENAELEIGRECGFSGTVIGCAKHIKIGNNVMVGANSLITDSDWHWQDARLGENKEVIIGNNVFIGTGVKILKGVHIGENSVIGAGSIVVKDLPANVVAAGNPCKVLNTINESLLPNRNIVP